MNGVGLRAMFVYYQADILLHRTNLKARICYALIYLRTQQHSRCDGDREITDNKHYRVQVMIKIEIVIEVDHSDICAVIARGRINSGKSQNPNWSESKYSIKKLARAINLRSPTLELSSWALKAPEARDFGMRGMLWYGRWGIQSWLSKPVQKLCETSVKHDTVRGI